jgi:hypothetical protein
MLTRRTILAAASVAAIICSSAASAQSPITIGAIEILTGPNNKYGIAIKNGFDLALEDVNKAGGVLGAPLAIAYEDSAGNKDQALNAARQFLAPLCRMKCSRLALWRLSVAFRLSAHQPQPMASPRLAPMSSAPLCLRLM